MTDGWVKLYRKMTDWEWYQDSSIVHLFIHLLLMASRKEYRWRGHVLHAGQFVTSIRQLQSQTGISHNTISKDLRRLEESGEIRREQNGNVTLITVLKYGEYQGECTTECTSRCTTECTSRCTKISAHNNNNKNNKNIITTTTKENPKEIELDENGMKVAQYFFGRFGGSKLSKKALTYLRTALKSYTVKELVKVIDLAYDDPMIQNHNSRKSLSYIFDMDRVATYLNNAGK